MAHNIYYIDADNGSDSNDGSSEVQAWATIQKAFDSGSLGSDGTTIYVQAATAEYAYSTSAWAPNANAPLYITGYNTTPGEIVTSRANMPSIDAAANGYAVPADKSYSCYSNLIMHGNGSARLMHLGAYSHMFNCELYFDEAEVGNNYLLLVDTNIYAQYCYFHDWNRGVIGTYSNQWANCLFVDETGDFGTRTVDSCLVLNGPALLDNNIFVKNDSTGYTTVVGSYSLRLNQCSFYNSANSTNDKALTFIHPNAQITNCLFEGWSGTSNALISGDSQAVIVGNSYRDTATAFTSFTGVPTSGLHADNEAISGSVFVDAANGDFTPADLGNIIEGAVPLKIGGTGAP